MPRIELDLKISVGNIITIGMVLFAIIGAWFTLVSQQSRIAEKVAVMEAAAVTRTTARDRQMAEHEARIRAVEIAQAGQSSDLRSIQSGISRIEAQLEKLQLRP